MLLLSRRPHESVTITTAGGEVITIFNLDAKTTLGIEANKSMKIVRTELVEPKGTDHESV